MFFPSLRHACHSARSAFLKGVLLYIIIIITELLANLLSRLSRSFRMGGKQSETQRSVPPRNVSNHSHRVHTRASFCLHTIIKKDPIFFFFQPAAAVRLTTLVSPSVHFIFYSPSLSHPMRCRKHFHLRDDFLCSLEMPP